MWFNQQQIGTNKSWNDSNLHANTIVIRHIESNVMTAFPQPIFTESEWENYFEFVWRN